MLLYWPVPGRRYSSDSFDVFPLPANPAWEDHWHALSSWRDGGKNNPDTLPPHGRQYLADEAGEYDDVD